MMKTTANIEKKACFICDREADETGSHIVPASLIKNCVGKHYREESYEIDVKKAAGDVYFGRDNLKNTSTEIKPNPYKRDHILCKECESRLAAIESRFSAEFLTKFRKDKYAANFTKSKTAHLEVYEPNKISHLEILAYFYSIIYRTCRVYEIEGQGKYLTSQELDAIKEFVHGYLYASQEDYTDKIKHYKLSIIFDKTSDESLHIGTSNTFDPPYIFFLCDVIVQLYTREIPEKDTILFEGAFNLLNQESTKIIVGPDMFYKKYTQMFTNLLAADFIKNGISDISRRNGKSFEANMAEYEALLNQYNKKGETNSSVKAFDDLRIKYP
ncbi:hypothetical protein [Myroides odoratus]|uniref:hypothetical protein n=1 Tax=Myroides odoratus TaxID=256 RepID=UPI0039B0E66B